MTYDPADDNEPVTLLGAVLDLSHNVVTLTERLDVSVKQARKTLVLTIVVSLVVLALGGLFWRLHQDVIQNETNATQQCVNSNDARAANLALWNFVLDTSEAGKTPEQTANAEKIREYVTILFAPRDCNDLGHHYELPPPPTLTPTA